MINNKEEYILCSAIHYFNFENTDNLPLNLNKGILITGRRHSDCIFTWWKLTATQTNNSNSTQGFLSSTNKFYNRQDAIFIAMLSGQITKEKVNEITQLYSEDLW